MVDCLEYAIKKENELPKFIEIFLKKISKNDLSEMDSFNKKMRSAQEILKDYEISMEV